MKRSQYRPTVQEEIIGTHSLQMFLQNQIERNTLAQSAWCFCLFVIFSLILTSFYPDIWIYLRFHPFLIKMAELFLLAKCQWTANANIYNIIMQLWYKTIITIPCYFFIFFLLAITIFIRFFFNPGGAG